MTVTLTFVYNAGGNPVFPGKRNPGWISVDTPLRNIKYETTMVPFHRVQQGKDHQDSERMKLFWDPFTFSVFQPRHNFGREKKAYASRVCHNDRDTDVCVECLGETGIGRVKESYASRNIPMTVTGENRYGPGK